MLWKPLFIARGGHVMEYLFQNYIRKSSYRNTVLKHFCNTGSKLVFGKNEMIECQYRKLDGVYLITKGKVKQYFISSDGVERTILLLAKGDIFGEITLFQGDFDMVMTEALEKTEVRKISKEDFFNVLNNHNELFYALFEMITTKFRILMAQIYDNTYYPARDRLINLLMRLSRQYGVKENDTIRIDIRLTHEEIANMIGTTRSTVSKIVKELTRANVIYTKNKFIYLADDVLSMRTVMPIKEKKDGSINHG